VKKGRADEAKEHCRFLSEKGKTKTHNVGTVESAL